MRLASEGLRLGRRELLVGQRARGVELREMLDLSAVSAGRRILRRLLGGPSSKPAAFFIACVVSNRRSGYSARRLSVA
jgi:hypothetical protein